MVRPLTIPTLDIKSRKFCIYHNNGTGLSTKSTIYIYSLSYNVRVECSFYACAHTYKDTITLSNFLYNLHFTSVVPGLATVAPLVGDCDHL